MAIYSKEIIKHFKKPQNVGKIKDADGIGEAGNLLCGDIMKLYLKIEKNKKGEKVIRDIKFETLGCIVAIANTSLLTTLVKGKTINDALRIKKEDLVKRLGPLPKRWLVMPGSARAPSGAGPENQIPGSCCAGW